MRLGEACTIEPLEDRRLFAAGNILVGLATRDQGQSYDVFQYTPAGQQVGSSLYAPVFNDGTTKDVVVSPGGGLVAYNGGWPPDGHVVTVAGGIATGTHTIDGMNLVGRTFYGGIATLGRYVYAADMAQGGDSGPGQQGVIRFDTAQGWSAQRFLTDHSIQDVSLGADGLIYALDGGTRQAFALNPQTMATVRTIQLPFTDCGGMTADSSGNVYLGTFGDGLYKIAPDGTVLMHDTTNSPIDLDMSTDNRLLGSNNTLVTVWDTSLKVVSQFRTSAAPAFRSSHGLPASPDNWNTYADADADANSHAYADTYTDSNADFDSNADSDAHTNSDSDSHAYPNSDTDPNSHTNDP